MRCATTIVALVAAVCLDGCETPRPAATTTAPQRGAESAAPAGSATAPLPDEIIVGTEPDAEALEELLNAAPRQQLASTGPNGGTLVGTDTARPSDDDQQSTRPVDIPIPPPPEAKLEAGQMEIQPALSNPAIERAAREQFYWPLVQKCRGPDGEILPPETITLVFTIGPDGAVAPGTVGATASERKYDAAADCVVMEFSALPFRGPAAALGASTSVISTLPSVD
jgi:hypothetical protein